MIHWILQVIKYFKTKKVDSWRRQYLYQLLELYISGNASLWEYSIKKKNFEYEELILDLKIEKGDLERKYSGNLQVRFS